MPEDKTAIDIQTKFDAAKSDMRQKRDSWLEMYRLYRNYKSNVTGDRNNIGIPLAFEWVEVVLSRLFDVFAGKRPYVRVKGREPSDDLAAKSIELYQNYQYDLACYPKLVYDVLHQVLIFGTGIVKVYWKLKKGDRTVYVPIDAIRPEFGSLPETQNVTIYDNIAFELVDVFDFAIDPQATSLEDAVWVAHESMKTSDYLQEMEDLGIYKGVRKVLMERTEENGGAEVSQERQEILAMEGRTVPIVAKSNHKILEYVEDDKIITIMDGKYEIRNNDNPYHCKNYVVGKIVSTPHEFWGISLIEPGAQLSAVINDIANNMLDNQAHAINKMIGVDELRVDDTELVSRPFGFLHTRGNPRDALHEFPFTDIGPSGFQMINLMWAFSKGITSLSDYVVGQSSVGRTASEAQLLANEAAKRIGLHIRIFGDTFAGKLAHMVHKFNRLFQVDEKVFRVTGMKDSVYEEVRVTPDMFGTDVDFIWEHSDRELNNMVARQEMTQLLSIASTNPILMGFIPTLFVKMLETYDLHQNDRLMQAAKLAETMVPLMQQAAMMGGGAAGGGGIPNAQKLAGGSEANVSQSMNRKGNPTYGSLVNVK